MVAFGGVVVDHIHDHLNIVFMECTYHCLELIDNPTRSTDGAIALLRGEEAKGVVAPVVA